MGPNTIGMRDTWGTIAIAEISNGDSIRLAVKCRVVQHTERIEYFRIGQDSGALEHHLMMNFMQPSITTPIISSV